MSEDYKLTIMKELSTEEKAKAYDEALEKARLVLQERGNEPDGASILSELFPELKESEDEKIRKEIIDILDSYDVAHLKSAGLPKRIPEYIAWLEKRDEQKCGGDVNDEALQKQLQIWFDKGKCSGIDEVRNNPEKYGLQGEQKPVVHKFRVGDTIHYIKCKENFGIIDAVGNNGYLLNDATFISFENQDEWKLVEQKPVEWSEEDESMLTRCIGILGKCYIGELPTKVEEELNWLKSLKDRCIPQTKTEWSEDDEMIYKHCLVILHDYGYDTWLKSLRPQKQEQWNEQDIEMIDWLIRCCEKEYEELCNDRYGHQEIVSDLKRDCRKKWDWLESLKSKVVPQKQWKPSEYEIQLLKDVASGVKDPVAYGASMGVIIGGLEQLKAL